MRHSSLPFMINNRKTKQSPFFSFHAKRKTIKYIKMLYPCSFVRSSVVNFYMLFTCFPQSFFVNFHVISMFSLVPLCQFQCYLHVSPCPPLSFPVLFTCFHSVPLCQFPCYLHTSLSLSSSISMLFTRITQSLFGK